MKRPGPITIASMIIAFAGGTDRLSQHDDVVVLRAVADGTAGRQVAAKGASVAMAELIRVLEDPSRCKVPIFPGDQHIIFAERSVASNCREAGKARRQYGYAAGPFL